MYSIRRILHEDTLRLCSEADIFMEEVHELKKVPEYLGRGLHFFREDLEIVFDSIEAKNLDLS